MMGGVNETEAPVLVTGGTGFVGGWCVSELLRRGHVVRTTVRNVARSVFPPVPNVDSVLVLLQRTGPAPDPQLRRVDRLGHTFAWDDDYPVVVR